jgi:hypothetical protein
MAGNGSSATTKALTGNTNLNVYFSFSSCWFNNGTFYVAFVQSTRAVAAGAVADSWTLNGIYIQGVSMSTGALVYNTTGGVKAIALTQTVSGALTCVASTTTQPAGCASSAPSGQASAFMVGSMNWTTTDTVQYLWLDSSTATAQVIKTGTINCTTGAATSGNSLATFTSVATGAGTVASPAVTTTYFPAGFLASFGTYGVFLAKSVYTNTGVAASTGTVMTNQAFYNGSTTANTNVTTASGYYSGGVQGFHTADGFILIESQSATTTPTSGQGTLYQAERFFTNGSASGTAVSLGTYGSSDMQNAYQDTNGSIILGYALRDTASSTSPKKTYSGYMGTYVAQQLTGASLTSFIGLLSFMIVALFAF